MDRPLQVLLNPSRIASYYCAVVILLSWFAIGLADLFLLVQILLSAVVAACGWRTVQQLRTLPFSSLEYRNKNWFVRVGGGFQENDLQVNSLQAVELQQNSFVGAGIIVMSFQLPTGNKMRAVLWPDSAEADSLRQLRATLLAGA